MNSSESAEEMNFKVKTDSNGGTNELNNLNLNMLLPYLVKTRHMLICYMYEETKFNACPYL